MDCAGPLGYLALGPAQGKDRCRVLERPAIVNTPSLTPSTLVSLGEIADHQVLSATSG